MRAILFAIGIFLMAPLLFAASSFSVPYPLAGNSSASPSVLDSSSVLMEVTTPYIATCRYSTTAGLPFSLMSSPFSLTAGQVHQQTLVGLENGMHNYYVKCLSDPLNITSEPPELSLLFRVNIPVTATVSLSEEDPLSSGTTDVVLTTSELLSGTPALEYSFDGVVYENLPLYGSGTSWKGYLIIPKSLGDAVLSFRFQGRDLSGTSSTTLTGQSSFLIDTVKPLLVGSFEAKGQSGAIDLTWRSTEKDIEEYRLYRSTEPNPGYTDYYRTVDEEDYLDTLVERGKRYYYRVSAVDEAGNEGDLSIEVSAAAALSNTTSSSSSGLDHSLYGEVDNFLVELDYLVSDIDRTKDDLSDLSGDEARVLSDFDSLTTLEQLSSELSTLRRDVVRYKDQDLSESELTRRLDSARVKLSVFEKQAPERVAILDRLTTPEVPTQERLERLLLELYPEKSEAEIRRQAKYSLEQAEAISLSVQNFFAHVQFDYLDGHTEEYWLVSREISAQVERNLSLQYIEYIPKDLATSLDSVDLLQGGFSILKEDPILSLSVEEKSLAYAFTTEKEVQSLGATAFFFVADLPLSSPSPFTGYAIFSSGDMGIWSAGILGFFLLGLMGYLVHLKRSSPSDSLLLALETKNTLEKALAEGAHEAAREAYASLRHTYTRLSSRERRKLYTELLHLQDHLQRLSKEGPSHA